MEFLTLTNTGCGYRGEVMREWKYNLNNDVENDSNSRRDV